MKAWLESLAQSAEPSLDECIKNLGKLLPLLYEFKNTEQDGQWHAEGNVHIHTQMVLNELYELLNDDALHIKGRQRQALILAACLHDIAKPLTTKRVLINGIERVTARGHEDMGRSYLAYRLIELPLDYRIIHCILQLVGEHQKPKLLVVKNQPIHKFFKLARQVDLELLYWLELADMRGRECTDKETQLDYLELFKLEAQTHGCWRPKELYEYWQDFIKTQLINFSNEMNSLVLMNGLRDFEAGNIYSPEEAVSKSYDLRHGFPELIIMCAPSGSGKSSFIKALPSTYDVISMDEIREKITGDRSNQKVNGQVRQQAKEQLKAGLRQHKKLIWDATSLRKDFRDPLVTLAKNYGALVTLVVIVKPEQELRKDNKARSQAVPDDVLSIQLERWQWPTVLEADRYLVVDAKNKVNWAQGWIDAVTGICGESIELSDLF